MDGMAVIGYRVGRAPMVRLRLNRGTLALSDTGRTPINTLLDRRDPFGVGRRMDPTPPPPSARIHGRTLLAERPSNLLTGMGQGWTRGRGAGLQLQHFN